MWSACGLRTGALVSDNPEFHARAVAENTANLCPNVIGQWIFAALAHESHEDLQAWYAQQRAYYADMLGSVSQGLRNLVPGIIVSSPDASIYSVIEVRECTKPGFDALDFVLACARQGSVEIDGEQLTLLVSPMAGFYRTTPGEQNPGTTQMRIAYVETPERMKLLPRLFAALLQDDAEAQGRLTAIEESNQELLERFPTDVVFEEVERRLAAAPAEPERRPRPALGRAPIWVAAAACAVLAGVVLLPGGEERPGSRTKGTRPALVAHRVVDGATEQLATGDAARTKDRIQLSLLRAAGRHVVVVSIDGGGQVTLHYPFDAAEAVPVGRARFTLPRSYELDDAPGFERFVLVSAPVPVPPEAVLESARRLAARGAAARTAPLGDLPPEAEQTSLLLEKVP